MKTKMWKTSLMTAALAGLAMGGFTALAQNTPGTPVLAPAAQQVLQLEQAKISDEVVIAYIRNSGSSYGLTADQIVYLRAQGVSGPVLTAMLNSTAPATTVPPAAPAPAPAPTVAANPTAAVPATTPPTPATTYVVPDSTTYYDPYYYGYPDYYGYGWYPPVSVNLGWGWHGGYGWHGEGHGGGGWHGGGGHGGWHH